MPELPDVEVLKRYLDSTALHKPISGIDVRDSQILANISAPKLNSHLTHQEFKRTSRRGKVLFAHLDDNVLVLHFGMTGDLHYYKDPEQEPEYTQMLIKFDNGYHLAYVMPRKLGEVRLIEDIDAFIRAKELGPDVLSDDFTFDAFRQRLSERRGMIKTRLMDQKIMAGIGNVYSDEILFQSHIHPETQVEDLDDQTLHTIYDKMTYVLEVAIENNANPESFPDDFLIPQRHEDGNCPNCDAEVKRIEIAGRSAYFCPDCQEKL